MWIDSSNIIHNIDLGLFLFNTLRCLLFRIVACNSTLVSTSWLFCRSKSIFVIFELEIHLFLFPSSHSSVLEWYVFGLCARGTLETWPSLWSWFVGKDGCRRALPVAAQPLHSSQIYSHRKKRFARSAHSARKWSRTARCRNGFASRLATRFGAYSLLASCEDDFIAFMTFALDWILPFIQYNFCSYNAKRRNWRRTKLGI